GPGGPDEDESFAVGYVERDVADAGPGAGVDFADFIEGDGGHEGWSGRSDGRRGRRGPVAEQVDLRVVGVDGPVERLVGRDTGDAEIGRQGNEEGVVDGQAVAGGKGEGRPE